MEWLLPTLNAFGSIALFVFICEAYLIYLTILLIQKRDEDSPQPAIQTHANTHAELTGVRKTDPVRDLVKSQPQEQPKPQEQSKPQEQPKPQVKEAPKEIVIDPLPQNYDPITYQPSLGSTQNARVSGKNFVLEALPDQL